MNTISERIKMIIEYYGLNINTFSLRAGMANNSIIGKIVNDKQKKPSYETILKILTAFPKVDCTWLITGRGEMFGSSDDNLPDVTDRVMHVMKKFSLSLKEMSYKIDVPPPELNDVMIKKRDPDVRLLTSIASAFPEIEPLWLFMNEGEMMRQRGVKDTS